jgi:Bacterial Ig-like domain (group 3)
LLACAFLLPAFAAQAQVNTQIQVTTQSPNPSSIGQQVTFVVTVTAVSGTASPTGMVNLSANFSTLGTGNLSPVSAGVASTTIPVTFNQNGSETILVNYGGVANTFNGSNIQVTQTVGTPTTLMSSPNPSQTNQSVTLTATVTATSGTATPTGTVTFVGPGANTLGLNVPLTGSGTTATAQITTTARHSDQYQQCRHPDRHRHLCRRPHLRSAACRCLAAAPLPPRRSRLRRL